MKLDSPDSNGITLRAKLLQVFDSCGIWDPQLDEVDVPEEAGFLWNCFWDLQRDTKLTYLEVKAYQELNGLEFTVWEIGTLMAMSDEVVSYINDTIKEKMNGSGKASN